MSNNKPPFIEETNLSYAWGSAFLHIIKNSGKEISPLLITLTGFVNGEPQEDSTIRQELDKCLTDNKEQVVHTVANTIFPASYWRMAKSDRQKLFNIYLENFSRIKALAKSKNHRGLYFERLIAFDSELENSNQLEYVISQYNSRQSVRRTMLQTSIFDPRRDHITTAQLGFPCLQHLSFIPDNTNKTLTLNAFYATQQIFNKAYGNYLGLCRLGSFMAHEMKLTFHRMNCFVGVAKLDTIGKKDNSLIPLIKTVQNALPKTTDEQEVDGAKNDE